MSHCELCWNTLGLHREHTEDEVCSVREALWCSQCGCKGHTVSACTEMTHVVRPQFLEELIPADVRARWNIRTQTPIVWTTPTLADQERELPESQVLEVRYHEGKRDTEIREVMRSLGLSPIHKMEGNIHRLRVWAVENGKKLRLIQEDEWRCRD